VQPVGAVLYTFWFQFCSNMLMSKADPARPGVRAFWGRGAALRAGAAARAPLADAVTARTVAG
jgi:hypothetical protein